MLFCRRASPPGQGSSVWPRLGSLGCRTGLFEESIEQRQQFQDPLCHRDEDADVLAASEESQTRAAESGRIYVLRAVEGGRLEVWVPHATGDNEIDFTSDDLGQSFAESEADIEHVASPERKATMKSTSLRSESNRSESTDPNTRGDAEVALISEATVKVVASGERPGSADNGDGSGDGGGPVYRHIVIRTDSNDSPNCPPGCAPASSARRSSNVPSTQWPSFLKGDR